MDNLREFQLELLKMLEEMDTILTDEKISYFLIGGSVLGTIRHKGFIPWDDDIDIGLYRKDFEKLESFFENYFSEKISYEKIGKNINQSEPIGRIYLKKEYEEKKISKVIDVFPIDNVPENNFFRFIQYFFCQVYHISIHKKPAKNRGKIAYCFTKLILALFPNILLNFLQSLSKKVITYWNKKETKDVANIYGIKGFYKEIMPREYIGKPILKEFEGKKYPIPKNWDKYLTHLYGDYMKLPDQKDRKPKHEKNKIKINLLEEEE